MTTPAAAPGRLLRVGIFLVVASAAGAAVLLRPAATPSAAPVVTDAKLTGARLVELGSTTCKSCKAMHEELAALRSECASGIAVEEIDVFKDEAAATKFGVRVIPTQIFLDGAGRELDRHTGFLARAEILARFDRHGVRCGP